MKKSKAVLIGAGTVAKHYADLLSNDSNFDLVAVVDIDIERARSHAEYWNAKYYEDLTQVLENHKVDVAIITTQSFQRRSINLLRTDYTLLQN